VMAVNQIFIHIVAKIILFQRAVPYSTIYLFTHFVQPFQKRNKAETIKSFFLKFGF
jgi:hypothetical protein